MRYYLLICAVGFAIPAGAAIHLALKPAAKPVAECVAPAPAKSLGYCELYNCKKEPK